MKHLLSIAVGYFQPIMNKELFKKHLSNKVVTMKNTDNFCYKRKPSHATAKLTLFTVGKDEWDQKWRHW